MVYSDNIICSDNIYSETFILVTIAVITFIVITFILITFVVITFVVITFVVIVFDQPSKQHYSDLTIKKLKCPFPAFFINLQNNCRSVIQLL